MISSLLNIMANAVRPLLRGSNDRQTRLNFLPVSRDDALQQAQRNNNNTPVATRRTSKSGPLLALADDDRSVKQLTHTPNKPPPPARTSSRKRPATALEDDATDTRPPSSGKLAAPPAVPAPASTASSTDKRSLRSHDGGSRLKSDLAVYFSNYDDIIAGVSKEDGMSLSHVAWPTS